MNSILLAQTLPAVLAMVAVILLTFSLSAAFTTANLIRVSDKGVHDVLQASAILAFGLTVSFCFLLPTVLYNFSATLRVVCIGSVALSTGAVLGMLSGSLVVWTLRRITAHTPGQRVPG
jgi:phosphate starvation-inducible membrane PsiE